MYCKNPSVESGRRRAALLNQSSGSNDVPNDFQAMFRFRCRFAIASLLSAAVLSGSAGLAQPTRSPAGPAATEDEVWQVGTNPAHPFVFLDAAGNPN